ncbi:hypothetical protein [Rhodanobacter aciditrophus]|uniref:hypothetical protein n=1 Tax=Rhodanobacter aciditrophus TaxID=1623218 RepID=UPI003CE83860
MKNLAIASLSFLLAVLCASCAHDASIPKVDRSPNLDLSPIAKRFGVPRCKVSVPLTQEQVLLAAKRQGDPYTEKRPEWATIKREAKPGDQLRQVICLTTGPQGYAAGDVFYGLFRRGKMVAEMHTIIIN